MWNFSWRAPRIVSENEFEDGQKVSGMEVEASINNYDIVKDLGEDKIRETVYDDFYNYYLKQAGDGWKFEEKDDMSFFKIMENPFKKAVKDEGVNVNEENIKKVFDEWFNASFIDELNKNKDKLDYSTDFSIYVDDTVKVFAKDLKEYDGTTLQYIGIMPKEEDLDTYINHTESSDILNLISQLKELKNENFKDGYFTYIHGHIPKFNFEYELNLKDDLKEIGITDVFEQGKANLTNMTDDNSVFIDTVKHKANIEFTQEGIKAAAATFLGGDGAGDWYDYYFEMPTEEIDITFDKPYMFLIRDKETGETWFVGTVYEPLDWEEDNTREEFYDFSQLH